MISKIGKLLQSEIAALCSNRSESVLRCHSNEQILSFEWERVIPEMREHAPTLLTLLYSATHTRRTRPNRDFVIAMCTAMMCPYPFWRTCIKAGMYLWQGIPPVHKHVPTIIQVFVRLHNLGITMSYTGTLSLIGQLGENHDAKVHEWKESLLD